jgi:pimeloyl-ACP methyl ester carboxylesterase
LAIERAVVFPGWDDIASYLAEQHPDRLAGLIYSGAPQPDPRRLWDADPTGVLAMAPRLFFIDDGLDPDEMFRRLRRSWYAPRFLEHVAAIDVPALFLVGQTGSSGVEDRWHNDLQIARWVAANPTVGDSLTRTFYARLLADDSLQAEVRAVYRDLVAPAHRAAEQRFRAAFGEQLREVRLGVPNVSGYAYRDEPDLIYPHIRRFLDEISGREAGATGGGHVVTPNGEQGAYTAPADVR